MPPAHSGPVKPDTLITVKAHFDGENRRFKVPLRDMGATTFPLRVRQFLNIPSHTEIILRRYSDSAGQFLTLDSEQPAGYKQLYRAAKAKLKLRIQVDRVYTDAHDEPEEENPTDSIVDNNDQVETKPEELSEQPQSGFEFPIENGHLSETNLALPDKVNSPRSSYLDTVLEHRPAESPSATRMLDSRAVYPPPPVLPANTSTATYSCSIMIDCNLCKASIPNEHYHCSVCEGGDYDLCQECVDAGNLCPAGTHWLIKRSLNDGQLISSTTEIVGPKFFKPVEQKEKEEPKEELKEEPKKESKPEPAEATAEVEYQPKSQKPEPAEIIRDFDYRPSEPVIHRALCDMCDCQIINARYKCIDCPNWDVCASCVGNAKFSHPGHRFVPLFLPLPPRASHHVVHPGVYCDGRLCHGKFNNQYITGIRYKCVVCDDTDFCETCEADPNSTHNSTHPLLKFKTPVKHVTVSAYGEDEKGQVFERLGDKDAPEPAFRSTATETTAPFITNAATQVHPPMALDAFYEDEKEISYETQEVVEEEETPVAQQESMTSEYESVTSSLPHRGIDSNSVTSGLHPDGLHTRFLGETIPDGTHFAPNDRFAKTWTVHNVGPSAWPAGTAVRFQGGDPMFDIDTSHATSLTSLISAMESKPLTEQVYPGQKADFTIVMKAPARIGTAISFWCLRTEGGTHFGHQLSCHIEVVEPKRESPEKKSEMVFPKLEKESPMTSMHEAECQSKPNETVADNAFDSASTLNEDTDAVEVTDLAAEVNSLDLENECPDDESFLTDEEYDILDASDEEYAEIAKASQKK
ncbi:ZZ type zinc finger domain-containing protein [Trichophyton interdigitale]|uniref:ZZ type zinc finger domain-containing protein n=1 Tax=Trichophyton interdigitale TaxID=101480 RepID=A0A9P5CXF8_9EURO|nr:ZZ type zinc finger domain-containing protein [Trichophyton interdigitale]KAF3895231.1 ZZ type zinc finger domain-containing protein [Trichophyton interdigitale]KAG8208709.1 ZZ type zinc finger domain-containing protein [Trichophyton interdigitale]